VSGVTGLTNEIEMVTQGSIQFEKLLSLCFNRRRGSRGRRFARNFAK
jgi:hypothetical protein